MIGWISPEGLRRDGGEAVEGGGGTVEDWQRDGRGMAEGAGGMVEGAAEGLGNWAFVSTFAV